MITEWKNSYMPLLDGRSREREKMCVTARNFVKRAKCKSTKKTTWRTNKQTNKQTSYWCWACIYFMPSSRSSDGRHQITWSYVAYICLSLHLFLCAYKYKNRNFTFFCDGCHWLLPAGLTSSCLPQPPTIDPLYLIFYNSGEWTPSRGEQEKWRCDGETSLLYSAVS